MLQIKLHSMIFFGDMDRLACPVATSYVSCYELCNKERNVILRPRPDACHWQYLFYDTNSHLSNQSECQRLCTNSQQSKSEFVVRLPVHARALLAAFCPASDLHQQNYRSSAPIPKLERKSRGWQPSFYISPAVLDDWVQAAITPGTVTVLELLLAMGPDDHYSFMCSVLSSSDSSTITSLSLSGYAPSPFHVASRECLPVVDFP
jgi:hypothetical protein